MVCSGFEPGAAGSRRRRVHCAMAAPYIFDTSIVLCQSLIAPILEFSAQVWSQWQSTFESSKSSYFHSDFFQGFKTTFFALRRLQKHFLCKIFNNFVQEIAAVDDDGTCKCTFRNSKFAQNITAKSKAENS